MADIAVARFVCMKDTNAAPKLLLPGQRQWPGRLSPVRRRKLLQRDFHPGIARKIIAMWQHKKRRIQQREQFL